VTRFDFALQPNPFAATCIVPGSPTRTGTGLLRSTQRELLLVFLLRRLINRPHSLRRNHPAKRATRGPTKMSNSASSASHKVIFNSLAPFPVPNRFLQ
jgi:hypothetical protein